MLTPASFPEREATRFGSGTRASSSPVTCCTDVVRVRSCRSIPKAVTTSPSSRKAVWVMEKVRLTTPPGAIVIC